MDSLNQHCWCGNQKLIYFSPHYLKCPACETLIAAWMREHKGDQPAGQEKDFYGRGYWFTHQLEDLHHPDIIKRARQDLAERCLHWLRTVLRYKLPPASALELGSAHGGFVALLRWAGYEAVGLEISPWVAEFARETFHIPMLLGPVEEQALEPHSLDMIILMDVLEHLPDPQKAMTSCLHLLKEDGLLLIQTPCLPEGIAYDQMVASQDRFLEMLIEKEHLHLFSRKSVREIFGRLGVDHIEFEPAIFGHYDMFLVASREPLIPHLPRQIEEALLSSPQGRMVQALLDLDTQRQELANRYAESESDRAARLEAINRLKKAQSVLKALRSGRVYRALRAMGRWSEMDEMISQCLPLHPEEKESPFKEPRRTPLPLSEIKLSRIAVDLTPLLPGGENGGAKLLAMNLVRHMSQILPDCEFILFTSDRNHAELAVLDSPNIRRLCMIQRRDASAASSRGRALLLKRLRIRIQEKLAFFLPPSFLSRAKSIYRFFRYSTPPKRILQEIGADLLFCPFTAPFFFDPATPVVSIIYDLQFHFYPRFFEAEDLYNRERHFKETCRLGDRLICISEYVRDTVLKNSAILPEQVVSIPIRLSGRLKMPNPEMVPAILHKYELKENEFLLYPANFWPHKNHPMLLTAWGMYRSRHRESTFRLVCTGSPDDRMACLREAVQRMGMENWVLFPGFLAEEEFAALLTSCRALIFPSLYEGFGMPVLEAMAFGKPVLCSNVTSLPETAGDAALYFDPKKPKEILSAIEKIAADSQLATHLIELGYKRAALFGDGRRMAAEYLKIFQEVIGGVRQLPEALHGVYADGWTKERIFVTHGSSGQPRILEVQFEVPKTFPHKHVRVKVSDGKTSPEQHFLKRGKRLFIRYLLPKSDGIVEFLFEPSYQPKEYGPSGDDRLLGCLCRGCSILSGEKRESLLRV